MMREHRAMRALMLFTMLTPALGPAAALLLPVATALALTHARRGKALIWLLSALAMALALALGLNVADPRALQGLGQIGIAFGYFSFLLAILSPFLAAAPLLHRRLVPPKAAGLSLVAAAGALGPVLALSSQGQLGPLGAWAQAAEQTLPFAVLSVLSMVPMLYVLPKHPELEVLAERLGLTRTWWGWEGEDLRLTRRGRLVLVLPFSQPIPGLHAAKRGQHSTLPLLGDPVLDATLELSLPAILKELREDPAPLLAAVHGAGARLGPTELRLDRQVSAPLREDPEGQLALLEAQIMAARGLFERIEAQGLVREGGEGHLRGAGRVAAGSAGEDARGG